MSDPVQIDHACVSRIARRLVERRQTLAVAESSAGGLISASLLSVAGASAYFLGGGIIYTRQARETLLGITPGALGTVQSATEAMALLQARTIRDRLGADWGLAETGASGPGGNRYGDAAGHCCVGVVGPREASRILETGSPDRAANMTRFANAALALLDEMLGGNS